MRPTVRAIASAAIALLAGCATQRAMERSQLRLERLDQRLVEIGQRLAAVDSLLRFEQIQLRQQRAEQAADSERLQLQVLQVQARIDESARRLAEARQEVELLRVYGVGKGGTPAPAQATAPGAGGEAATPPLIADPQSLYDVAMASLRAGSYETAGREFAQFVGSFPDHELADNALYWQGECQYVSHQYVGAAASFEQVLQLYPQGDKVPAALLKLGFTRLALQETRQGTGHLQDLVRRFPDSPEAAAARERLQSLGGAGRPGSRR